MKMNKTVIRKTKVKDQGNDFAFWQACTPYERLLTLEQIRSEYNHWKYGTEQRLQRVFRVIKPV
jgi:hypothetical protein